MKIVKCDRCKVVIEGNGWPVFDSGGEKHELCPDCLSNYEDIRDGLEETKNMALDKFLRGE